MRNVGMNRRELIVASAAAMALMAQLRGRASAQEPDSGANSEVVRTEVARYAPPVQAFLDKAESLKPRLIETVQEPLGLVRPATDTSQALGWRIEPAGGPDAISQRVLKKGESLIIDFGGHRQGPFSFDLKGEGRGVDAPARLRLVFGEVVSDVAENFHPYKGVLSQAWWPDETINVDFLPQSVKLPRLPYRPASLRTRRSTASGPLSIS